MPATDMELNAAAEVEEGGLEKGIAHQKTRRGPSLLKVQSALASAMRVELSQLRLGFKIGFVAIMDFLHAQIDRGELGRKLEPPMRISVLQWMDRLRRYVEAHTFRSAYNVALRISKDGAGSGGERLRLRVDGIHIAGRGELGGGWSEKLFTYHNELNLMDIFEDIEEMKHLAKEAEGV